MRPEPSAARRMAVESSDRRDEFGRRIRITPALVFAALALLSMLSAPSARATLAYTWPVEKLGVGQSLGNANTYVTLDRTTDVAGESSSGRYSRNGFRESTDQRYYAFEWTLQVETAAGEHPKPIATSFHPAFQQTTYRLGAGGFSKTFFLPFETGYARAGHFLLERTSGGLGSLLVRSVLLLPAGTVVEPASLGSWKYARIRYPAGGSAILWGAAGAQIDTRTTSRGVVLVARYAWPEGQAFALSFVYSPADDGAPFGNVFDLLLWAAFDTSQPDAPNVRDYLFRVRSLLAASERAMDRYLDAARLITPDGVINRASGWSKVDQLRLQSDYRRGVGFTNTPPGDIVVARDSMWYLVGSDYYAQGWSRKLLDLWFEHGVEPDGKFTEYMTAAHAPLFRDDYGLNINDDTPLMMIAASHYYSLSGDRDFLRRAYPSLLQSADWIESQRTVGENNHYGLVWCTTTELGPRGMCSWRAVIPNYSLSGAVTEVNSEAYQALRAVAALARAIGDRTSALRYDHDADDLRQAINRYLLGGDARRRFYFLNIDNAGHANPQDTGDEIFPVLFDVAPPAVSADILEELFGRRFLVTGPGGAAGFRTLSSEDKEYRPKGYSLLGSVWPNVGLWIARAAAQQHRPDLALEALRGTALIAEMPDPGASGVVPGEFPECFDGEALRRQGEFSSPFVYGTFIWSSLESFLGLTPGPQGLTVEPELPKDWDWVGVSRIPYHGVPLTLLAVRKGMTLYSTAPVTTKWRTVIAPEELQERYQFEPKEDVVGLLLPRKGGGMDVIVGSSAATQVRIVDRVTKHEAGRFPIAAGGITRRELN